MQLVGFWFFCDAWLKVDTSRFFARVASAKWCQDSPQEFLQPPDDLFLLHA